MQHQPRFRSFATSVALGLALVLAWDAMGFDLALARWFGNAQGFALRDNFWMIKVLHDGAQRAGWVVVAGLALMCIWPVGALRKLGGLERVLLVLTTLLALLAIVGLKGASRTSCPWDLAEFGGSASYISHWAWGVWDGGPGHCFPAGHASTGFSMLAAYFFLRDKAPAAARVWLVAALVTGFGLGLVQQLRGAHFMSHTLWTAWICWTVSGSAQALVQLLSRSNRVRIPAV